MLSTKSKFSLGLGCLVALLIAVLLVPPAVHAAAPTFEVTAVNSPSDNTFRLGHMITITVKATVVGDGPLQYTADGAPATPVTLDVTIGAAPAKKFALRLDSAGAIATVGTERFPITGGLTGNLLFDYTVVAGDTDADGLTVATADVIAAADQFTDSGSGPAAADDPADVTISTAAATALAAARVDSVGLTNPVAIFQSPAQRYIAGDTIQVKVTFANAADGTATEDGPGLLVKAAANGNLPYVTLGIGNAALTGPPVVASTVTDKRAYYDATATTAAIRQTGLIFSYRLVGGDGVDTDGLEIKAGLSLNGAMIGNSDGATTVAPSPVQTLVPAAAATMAAVGPDLTRMVDAPDLGVPTEATPTLPSVTLKKEEFAVIAHTGAGVSDTGLVQRYHTMDLPNLDILLAGNGGTLELVYTGTGTLNEQVGPIISEIMWATDLSKSPSTRSQWIEIYNVKDAPDVNLSNYQLKVTPFSSAVFAADTKAVDTVSNLGDGRWNVPGQRGRSVAVAATGTTAGIAAVPLISMRRKINFANAKVEKKALKDVPNGTFEGSWEASTAPALDIGANRIATPGSAHVTQITRADQTSIPYSPVIINEIGNNTGDVNDWIELRNVSDSEANLKNWELSVVTADDDGTNQKDERVMVFPDKDYKLGAGKILLIVNKDPLETPLARGKKFGDADGTTAVADQENRGIQSDAMFYDAKGGLNALPESGKFLLVLRNGNDKKGTHEKIIDITGTRFAYNAALSTDIWPLRATPAGHGNVIDGGDEDFRAGKVYKRNDAAGGTGEKDWGVVGYTGIGYDRTADNTGANGGTPGFPNDSLKEKPGDVSGGAVTISEIMVVSNNGRYPQWVELRNSSQTHGVNLDAWRLRIENVGEVDSRRNVTIDLPNGFRLPPNQTMLIASRRGASSQSLTSQRVMLLWNDPDSRKSLEVQNARFRMMSTEGFTLKLFGKDQQTSDTPVDEVTIGAKLLTAAKIGDAQQRISLIRFYNGGIAGEWGSAKDSLQLTRNPSDTFYGASDDIGTPGFYPGSALPVSLSSFLPKRTDAGVVIKWTTQSELNNAGFNILRSATKTGEFVVINPTMIQGAGTTGEKNTYSYTDKTAKPNIVYYYQIEDVSFDGDRQRLTGATRLRGHIGAAGKLTTTWGDLKAQD